MKTYRAKIAALPASWNTNHWVVKALEATDVNDKSFYFSQNAFQGPEENSEVGDEGVIFKRFLNGTESSYIWCWTADDKPDKELEEWLEGEDD